MTVKNIPDEYRVTVPTEPQKMTVLIVPPMQEPYIKEISTGLEALQKEVGRAELKLYIRLRSLSVLFVMTRAKMREWN